MNNFDDIDWESYQESDDPLVNIIDRLIIEVVTMRALLLRAKIISWPTYQQLQKQIKKQLQQDVFRMKNKETDGS